VIECVPNVSDGRRPAIVADMAEAIRLTSGVHLLDYSLDASHNRSVFTFAGDEPGVERAVLALYERAVIDIDLRTHRGEHPRIGAVDVVPFVPIEGIAMEQCVVLARRVGAAIAARFDIPVYLYEEASTNPARRNLEDIRRGQFEGLAGKMKTAGWAPDFGPSQPHRTAGASAVGARLPLIAYNINLATDRIDVARAIAAAIRSSSGGLPCVKALGLTLAARGIVQVSINLTNYTRTPIVQAFDAVKAEAAKRGIEVLESEIVGLIPAAALEGTTPPHLQLKNFSGDQILENRLRAVGLSLEP
jgi:glutamate formiminotransferase